VSNIALGKQLSSARSLTLGKAASAEYLFPEWATPSFFGPSPSALALIAFWLSRSGWLFFHLPIQVTICYTPSAPPGNRAIRWVGQQRCLLFCMGACTSWEPFVTSLSSRSNTLLVIQCLGCQLPIAKHLKYILESQ
jgi:hypothetical protein